VDSFVVEIYKRTEGYWTATQNVIHILSHSIVAEQDFIWNKFLLRTLFER